MANEYYERLSEMNPGDLADGLAMEAEFNAIAQGFSKLPTPHIGGQGFDGPVRVGDAVNTDEAVSLGQLNAAIGEAVLLPIATYGDLNAAAWSALPSNNYVLYGTGAQFSNTPYTLVAGAVYTLIVRHVIGAPGVSLYHDILSLSSISDPTNVDLRRLFVRTGSTLANANSTGWAGHSFKRAAITALESLTPEANKVLYCTSNAELAMATLTPFARTLLDDADAAACRATIDAKQEDTYLSFLNTTNWCKIASVTLLQGGYTEVIEMFGSAGFNNTSNKATQKMEIILRSFNGSPSSISLTARQNNSSGIFSGICFTNPSGNTYDIYVQPRTMYATYIKTRGSRGVALSISNTGSGAPPAGSTAGVIHTLYDTFNILGPTSQSAGVPTGAIIERGSNANGEYTKFADGTLICTITLTTFNPGYPISTPGSRYRGTNGFKWIYPAAFSAEPALVCSAQRSYQEDATDILLSVIAAERVTYHVSARLAAAPTFYIETFSSWANIIVLMQLTAIGRWF